MPRINISSQNLVKLIQALPADLVFSNTTRLFTLRYTTWFPDDDRDDDRLAEIIGAFVSVPTLKPRLSGPLTARIINNEEKALGLEIDFTFPWSVSEDVVNALSR